MSDAVLEPGVDKASMGGSAGVVSAKGGNNLNKASVGDSGIAHSLRLLVPAAWMRGRNQEEKEERGKGRGLGRGYRVGIANGNAVAPQRGVLCAEAADKTPPGSYKDIPAHTADAVHSAGTAQSASASVDVDEGPILQFEATHRLHVLATKWALQPDRYTAVTLLG